jgi:hypothetical protein
LFASIANRVTEEEQDELGGQEEFGRQYHEFEPVPEDPNREQEFAKDADEGKSNLFPP